MSINAAHKTSPCKIHEKNAALYVILFLGWLEPLIHRLVEQPKALLCSKIGTINKEDLHVSFGDAGITKFVGFNFHLDEQWNKYDNSYLQKHRNLTQPLE